MKRSERILSLFSAAAVALEMMAGPLSPALHGAAAPYAAEGFSLTESDGDETVYEYDYEYDAAADADETDVTKERPQVYETVEISSIDDFLEFAENCHYDGWSVDKSVVLNVDLDFSGTDFESAASFGGLFDGQGHTISGIRMEDYVDETGLFGTIQNTGVVANLNVEGVIEPAGTQTTLGGIAGINYGTISNCTFSGSIRAQSEIGGIAGRNGLSGIVISCSTEGTINASSGSGGIVGYNEGTISSCVNAADVNTVYQDTTPGLNELTDALEVIEQSGSILNTGELSSNSDTGGIAGFSSGVITSCTNRGTVGYQHVGYNVGGIAGRSSGYLYRNENYGSIYGRKDVGGIAGQIQPYVTLSFTQETLDELSQEIDALQDAISCAMDSTGMYGDAVSSHLTNLSGLAQIAEDSVSDIISEGADSYDAAADKINAATGTLQSVLGTFSSVGDSLDTYLENVTGSVGDLGDYMEEYFGGISDSVQNLLESLQSIFSFSSSYELTGEGAQSSLSELEGLLEELLGDLEDGSAAALADGVSTDAGNPNGQGSNDAASAMELAEFSGRAQSAAQEREQAAAGASGEEAGGDAGADTSAEAQGGDVGSESASSPAQESGLSSASDGSEVQEETAGTARDSKEDAAAFAQELQDYQELEETLSEASRELADYLDDVQNEESDSQWLDESRILSLLGTILSGVRSLESSLKSMRGILSSYDTSSSASLKGLFAELSDALDAIGESPDILSEISDALDALASIDLQLNGVSDSLRTSGDTLYESISQILSEFEALNQDLSSMMDTAQSDFSEVGDRIDDLMDTLIGSAEGVMNAEFLDGEEETFLDVSDEEMEEGYYGRASECTNYGSVDADVNVGGIVGMVGVEYSLDPELDIETSGSTTLNYVFRARCIVDHCGNRGTVMAGTSGGGGIAGRMEMGLVAYCENYGALDCEGKYVGGIAGYSAGTIRDCTARCDLSGTTYIGGIAGFAATLRRNLAMVNVLESEQYIGAIAGRVGDVDASYLCDNYYYSESLYGIDGVSYEGLAEGVAYEELIAMSSLPDGFDELTLTFMVEDEILEVITCSYGETLSASQIPAIPEREGFCSEWSRTDFSAVTADDVVTASYERIVTLLTSEETREGGLCVVCVDGAFRQSDALVLTKEEPSGEELERWTLVIPEEVESGTGGLTGSDDGGTRSDEGTSLEEESESAQETAAGTGEVHRIRYLVPDDAGDAGAIRIYLIGEDGTRSRVETTAFSSYLTFEAEGNTVTFAAERVLSDNTLPVIGIVCAALLIAAAVLLRVHLQRQRKRRRKHSGREEKRTGGNVPTALSSGDGTESDSKEWEDGDDWDAWQQ